MYKKLLVPVDGRELSERAMADSLALAKSLGASVVGFVGEPAMNTPSDGRPAAVVAIEMQMHDERVTSHAREVLTQFELRAKDAGVPFVGRYRQTDHVDSAIAEAAGEAGCDLIVMATHGRGTFGELLFGSHTKGVMTRTKLPLLVLH